MTKLKIISRAIIIHEDKILLVKNKNRSFWSLPGGHWEFDQESLAACAVRETLEETGFHIDVSDMVFCQELRKPQSTVIEVFWGATLSKDNTRNPLSDEPHIDTDVESEIEEVKWIDKAIIKTIKLVPSGIDEYFVEGKIPKVFIGTFTFDN